MKQYCFDMSGISNPLETMPIDIHRSMWALIAEIFSSGIIAVTREIYDEMVHIPGPMGDCIKKNEENLVLEVGQRDWDWQTYTDHIGRMQVAYEKVISEYNGGRKNTICLNDLSIIALGRTLSLPVVSMEGKFVQVSEKRKRIPEVCQLEDVTHYDFSNFLRKSGIAV